MRRASAALAAFLISSAVALLPAQAASPVTLNVPNATLRVDLQGEDFSGGSAPLLEWVRRAAGIVSAYYGRFPAASATVRIVAVDGAGVQGGKTWADPDALIRVQVGRQVSEAQLQADWVLVHEMTHLALPDTGPQHAWLSEGLATYVEGVARVQAGNRSEVDVWAEELRSMPRGLPQEGDRGLDYTHTWGRTYWGGAMFCLLADVDIRRRTQLRLGLQDALRAVLNASGGLRADWPIERVLRTGDAAVGTRTLEDLYAQMGEQAMTPDLQGLWRQLGIVSADGTLRLEDSAPLAAVRRAIMTARAVRPGD